MNGQYFVGEVNNGVLVINGKNEEGYTYNARGEYLSTMSAGGLAEEMIEAANSKGYDIKDWSTSGAMHENIDMSLYFDVD